MSFRSRRLIIWLKYIAKSHEWPGFTVRWIYMLNNEDKEYKKEIIDFIKSIDYKGEETSNVWINLQNRFLSLGIKKASQ